MSPCWAETMESDVIFTAKSRFKRKIRLAKGTWLNKILRDHPELGTENEYVNEIKKAVKDPDYIIAGWFGEYLALRFCQIAPKSPKYLCVVYRELDKEGFIITTFFITKHINYLEGG